jgi:hypothetical protein
MNDILGMSDILGLDDISGDDAAAILGELLEGEDLSGDDLSGEDAMAILGAQLRGKGTGKNMIKKAIMARKIGGAQVLSNRKPSSSGVQAIGFFSGAVAVAANTQVTLTTQPQTWFKPMRLVVPGSIAPFFTIDNIIIGNKSQFPSPVSLPAETFIPEAQAVVMDLDTVNPALNLTLQVTNISGVAQNFRATFVGKEITP